MGIHDVPYEVIEGTLIALPDMRRTVLVTGDLPGELSSCPFVVRYGFTNQYVEHEILLLEYVFDDYRRKHTGFDAVEFVWRAGDRFPRADAIGYRASDGKYLERFVRDLDLGRSITALAYTGLGVHMPCPVDISIWLVAGAKGLEPVPTDEGLELSLLARSTAAFALGPHDFIHLPELLRDALTS